MYEVEVVNKGKSAFYVRSKDCEFVIDVNGNGITPPDTLLASLGSCIGVYVRKYAEGAKLRLEKFKIKVSAEFSKEPPARFKVINVSIDLIDADLDERRKKALLEFIKNCPVHNTLKADPAIQISIA